MAVMVLANVQVFAESEWAVYEDANDAMWSSQQWAELNAILYDEDEAASISAANAVVVDKNDLSVAQGLDSEVMNILLLGVDAASNNGRTDAMLVLSVSPNGDVKLTSIDRDTYVNLPVIKRWNRVNTAYVFGGANLAMKTVNELLGLNIERYAAVNFNGFKKIVDMLGGVEINLGAGEAQEISVTKSVGTGLQTLNGDQALAYVRIRSVDSTFGRSARHRNFLITMLNKIVKTRTLTQILQVVEEILPYLETNLTTEEVMNLVFNVLPYYEDTQVYSYPADGEWRYMTTATGASVVAVDRPEPAAEAVRKFIYGK